MHEGWRLRKDGSRFWGSIVITALHDEKGKVIGFSKVTRDLTDKKIAEDQMKQYMRNIEFQNKQLEEYAYVASHDLQEPLRKIQIFAGMLHNNIDDRPAQERNIEKIQSSARRMTTLIKDVLAYSRLSLTDELFVMTDLNLILENIKEDFELLLNETGAVINYSGLPIIKGIPIQLNQLFSNLITNAIKFSNDKPVIDISSRNAEISEIKKYPELDPGRRYVLILFRDNGVGIEPQYAEQIFKLFQRLDKTKYGTGIGLAMCKKIVENHQGHISVLSEVNKGTTFSIILPVS
jgi:signal transduction histidine kinase